jgi:hypothetical protein
MGYVTKFLVALLLDVIVEAAVLLLVLRKGLATSGLPAWRILYGASLVNLSSLPYLWFVLPVFVRNYGLFSVTGETAVFAWEALFYRVFFVTSLKQSALLSFLANLASFLSGLILLRFVS